MKIEIEGLARSDRLPIEMTGSENKRPRPVDKSAGTSFGGRFEHRRASELVKNRSECAAQPVGGGSSREQEFRMGLKREPQGVELEIQALHFAPGAANFVLSGLTATTTSVEWPR